MKRPEIIAVTAALAMGLATASFAAGGGAGGGAGGAEPRVALELPVERVAQGPGLAVVE